jgi:acetyltransferase-like isoleucine patch superfamily enzyme
MKDLVQIAKTAIVNDDCTIGKGSKIWNFANLYGCNIGEDCTIGSYVEIQNDVNIGNNVTVSSHSFLCSLVTIEDDVFIGHGVMTINDVNPPSKKRTGDNSQWKETIIKEGVMIGSNSTLFPVTIGEYSKISAGSVVRKDVEPYSIMAGNPARKIGEVKK